MRLEPAKEKRHEVERQAKRLERRSENRKLVMLKALLRAKVKDLPQQPLIGQQSEMP